MVHYPSKKLYFNGNFHRMEEGRRGPNIIFTSSLTSPSCQTPSGIDSKRAESQRPA